MSRTIEKNGRKKRYERRKMSQTMNDQYRILTKCQKGFIMGVKHEHELTPLVNKYVDTLIY